MVPLYHCLSCATLSGHGGVCQVPAWADRHHLRTPQASQALGIALPLDPGLGGLFSHLKEQRLVTYQQQSTSLATLLACRATCDTIGKVLEGEDVDVAVYHAGKDTRQRNRVQSDWSSGKQHNWQCG